MPERTAIAGLFRGERKRAIDTVTKQSGGGEAIPGQYPQGKSALNWAKSKVAGASALDETLEEIEEVNQTWWGQVKNGSLERQQGGRQKGEVFGFHLETGCRTS